MREEQRLEFLAALVREAELVEVTEVVKTCRDPKDDMYLALAASGNARYLVSSDADLLVHDPFRGIAILPPQEFLAAVQGKGP